VQSGVGMGIRKTLEGAIKAVNWIAQLTLGLMALAVIVNVLGRYLFKWPLRGTVEIVQLLLVVTVYFSVAYTEMRRGHVTMDEVVDHFPRRIKLIVGGIMYFATAIFILIMGWQSWILAWEHVRPEMRFTDVLHLPIAPVVFVMAIGLVLFGLELLLNGFSPFPSEEVKKKEME
jgi:TRAP-type transport system small permease protein